MYYASQIAKTEILPCYVTKKIPHYYICVLKINKKGFPGSSAGKESICNAGDPGLIPGSGRSPGEGKGYPLQSSGLENSMDCIVHGVAKGQTQLSNFPFCFSR